jgi:hypothetical protein
MAGSAQATCGGCGHMATIIREEALWFVVPRDGVRDGLAYQDLLMHKWLTYKACGQSADFVNCR